MSERMMEDAQIQVIIDRVMREIGQPTSQPISPARYSTQPADQAAYDAREMPGLEGDSGVFPTLDEAIAAAQQAFKDLNALPLAIRKDMVAHMRQAGRETKN